MSGREIYDITPLQKEVLEHRHARRTVLRQQYLEQTMNPYRHATGTGGYVDDIAINRFMAARATMNHYFRPKWNNFAYFVASYIFPMAVLGYLVKKERNAREHAIRTGQVAYADKENKIW